MLSAVSCDIYNVTAHRACRRELARTSAVENNVADSITADHYTVVNIVDIGKLAVLFNGAGADEYRNIAFRKPFGIAEQFYNAAVFFGCCNVFKRYIAYALCIYLVGLDRFAECKVGKNTYFSASIFAVNVGGGVGFRIAESLSFFERICKRRIFFYHLC